MSPTANPLAAVFDRLSSDLEALTFGAPVTHVYNPLVYARVPFDRYLELYSGGTKEAVFLGMNPGPFGMAQTGVPFGEVAAVREWLGIEGAIGRPESEHPKRTIQGFDCPRSEVSGRRVWGWTERRFGTAAKFFDRFFIANYCPLIFLEESGRNRTPDKLPAAEKEPLFAACDRALVATLDALSPRWVIGIGAFAEARARRIQESSDELREIRIGRILHPSPASPAANRGWAEQAERQLTELGIDLPVVAASPLGDRRERSR